MTTSLAGEEVIACKKDGEFVMLTRTKIAVAALLVAGSMSSAFAAETFDVDLYHANPNAPQAAATQTFGPYYANSGSQAYAQAQPRLAYAQAHPRAQIHVQPNPTAVYANGKYIGQDPDANVRLMLQKDFSFQ